MPSFRGAEGVCLGSVALLRLGLVGGANHSSVTKRLDVGRTRQLSGLNPSRP